MSERPKRNWEVPAGWKGNWTLPDVQTRPPSEDERRLLVTLACGGIGPSRLGRELETCATIGELARRVSPAHDPAPAMAVLERMGARAITPGDEEYPEALTTIHGPPPLLFVVGERLDSLGPQVAVVGARHCTAGARRFARQLASELAAAGFTVTSGLARGIDAAAHQGALETGATVAVLGTGLGRIYPAEHASLADQIVSTGALVTEFAPCTGPRPWHFPARNRIIAGMTLAVIVVEAGIGSGALITAQFALEGGREVYACTTGPSNVAGAGIRAMIRDGAPVVVDAEHALEQLGDVLAAHGLTLPGRAERAAATASALEGDEAAVCAAVTEQTTADEVVAATGLDVGKVASVLVRLELEGIVSDDGGGRYRRLT